MIRGTWDVGQGSAAPTGDPSLQDTRARLSLGSVHWHRDDPDLLGASGARARLGSQRSTAHATGKRTWLLRAQWSFHTLQL